MPGHDLTLRVDQYRVRKAETPDAFSNLLDLLFRMRPRVAIVGLEISECYSFEPLGPGYTSISHVKVLS